MVNVTSLEAQGHVAWFGADGSVELDSLILFASSRVDSMYLRFRLFSALAKSPLSKVDALNLLGISRPYLDRILKDWTTVGVVDVRDASAENTLKPRMTIYLVRRPVITVTRLDGKVERLEEPSALKETVLAIVSPKRQAILALLGQDKAWSVADLRKQIRQEDIYRHVRALLRGRLLLKIRVQGEGKQGSSRVVLRSNYRSIRFSLEPHTYR